MTTADWINIILVVVTAVYVTLTYMILRANQRIVERADEQINALVRPYVVASIETNEWPAINLKVANNGKTSAFNVKIEITPPLTRGDCAEDPIPRLIAAGIKHLPPEKDYEEYIDTTEKMLGLPEGEEFSGIVTYSDSNGRGYREDFKSDLYLKLNMLFSDEPEIPTELKNIRESLQSIGRDIRTLTNRDRERR